MTRVNQLKQDRWVRVMCDFHAEGIWRKDGVMGNIEDLEVTPEVYFMLGAWQRWHDDRDDRSPIPEMLKFIAYGWLIVWEIKKQHPDWTVVYFDEQTMGDVIGTRIWFKRSS